MPLGLSDNLFRRIVSALSLLPVVLGLIYLGGWWFVALVAVGGTLMALEWHHITSGEGRQSLFFMLGGLAVMLVFAALHPLFMREAPLIASAAISFCLLLLMILRPKTMQKGSIAAMLVGTAYIGSALVTLIWLRAADETGLTVVWLFFAVWAMDVGGYFAGKAIGGPKLAPTISPKKTWAGFVGGILLSALVGAAIAYLFNWIPPHFAALGSAVIAIVAQMGDLYESAVKRRFDVKDSGAIIPGHGGILDRVDGLIFAAPFTVLLLVWHQLVLGIGA